MTGPREVTLDKSKVEINSPLTAFGELAVAEITPIVQLHSSII